MDRKLKGTQTERYLAEALINESLTRSKYTFYAKVAKDEGYEQISDFFMKIADNELEHARIWFKYLDMLSDTFDNLEEARKSESIDWMETYQHYATVAEQEGFPEIAERFRIIARIEKEHEKIFRKLLLNIKDNRVYKRDEVRIWECRCCGNVIVSSYAPKICPACDNPQCHYEIRKNNY